MATFLNRDLPPYIAVPVPVGLLTFRPTLKGKEVFFRVYDPTVSEIGESDLDGEFVRMRIATKPGW